jgi:uncharacterized repeat protein (TIGR03803 family)
MNWLGTRMAVITGIFAGAYVIQAAAPSLEAICEFTGTDGANPEAPLVVGSGGELYGTTFDGGSQGEGTVFSLTPPSSAGGAWTETVLYEFTGGATGSYPAAGLTISPSGALYGSTTTGGNGVIFSLTPPTSAGGTWTYTVIFAFTGSDGAFPMGNILRLSTGVLLGTTNGGGANGSGVAYELNPPSSPGNPWTEKVLHNFGPPGGSDGNTPYAGLTYFRGVFYGTTGYGGTNDYGTIYSLTPPDGVGNWTEAILYNFTNGSDGAVPYGGLTANTQGVLYGTTTGSGDSDGGTVFSLTAPTSNGEPWNLTVLHNFTYATGLRPAGNLLLIPKSGVLFGTTQNGGNPSANGGVVYQLTPPAMSGGAWTFALVGVFDIGNGASPSAGVVLGTGGVLYGTTYFGGNNYNGTVFSLTL